LLGNHAWSGAEFVGRAALFFVLEAGALGALVWWVRPPKSSRGKALFLASMTSLAVLPVFRYGYFNDLVMRISIPSLMVLAIFTARALMERGSGNVRRLLLVAAMIAAAMAPLREFQRHVSRVARRGELVEVPDADRVRSLWELSCRIRDRRTNNDYFFRQYIGSPDSFFFKHLASGFDDADLESDGSLAEVNPTRR
jgi:hypothetical protein